MCVIERKTYSHADGRREIIETPLPCHNAVGSTLCAYVKTRNVDARVVEARPSSRGGSQSDDMITIGRDGREHRYRTLTRRTSHKASTSTRDNRRTTQSPIDSVSSTPSPFSPSYRTAEVKPSDAMASTTRTTPLPSARYPGPSGAFSPTTAPPDPYRIVTPGDSTPYDRPPSLESLRVNIERRPSTARRQSFDLATSGLPRRPSFSGMRSPPDLGHSRNDSANDLPASRTTSYRADEDLARRLQDEEDRQAKIERERINISLRKRRDSTAAAEDDARRARLDEAERRERNRLSRQAEEAARQRAAEAQRSREASRERRERALRDTEDALEGRRNAESRARELDERAEAELLQMEQEKENAARLKRDSVERYQELRSGPTTTRTTYSYGSRSPTASTRSPTGSARNPPAMVHNYPSSRRNSTLLERGDAVIERERRRVAGEMADGMARMSLEAAYDANAIVDADVRYSASDRARRERRERRRREEQRRLEEQGYF